MAMKRERPYLNNATWITLGGSYAGTLSAWARQSYPDLIDGAVSSSAPVLAKADFHEYVVRVQEALEEAQSGCCQSFDDTFRARSSSKQERLLNKVAVLAQYGTANDLEMFCAALRTGEQPIYSIPTDPPISDEEYKLWTYQRCNELGFFASYPTNTTVEVFDILISVFDILYYFTFSTSQDAEELCKEYNISWAEIKANVKATNLMHGGKVIANVSNIVFVRNERDPWTALAVDAETLNKASPVITLPQGSHCQDVLPEKWGETPEMRTARRDIYEAIKNLVLRVP